MSRGDGVEEQKHVDCNPSGPLRLLAVDAAIDVLMPFHSITTTELVESISDGLAKSPSEVLNSPRSLRQITAHARSAPSIAVRKRLAASS